MLLDVLRKKYYPLNTITISKENLLYNYHYLSQSSQLKIAPVLKSNAYGHGIVEVAKILDKVGAPFFCVDSLYEGYQLLKAKIKTPILIMGYVPPENLDVKKLPFSYAVYTYEMLEAIKKYQSHAGIHFFVDTGMHREGVLLENLGAFIEKAKSYDLKIEGLMSHFAMADKPESKETKKQISKFEKAQKIVSSLDVYPKYIHIAATSGVLNSSCLSCSNKILNQVQNEKKILGNVARVGIGFYGIDPEGKNDILKPVLTLTSTIGQIKQLKKGEGVGYGFTFTAKKEMKIAIISIGYNDGISRRLSNKGYVMVHGKACRIVGRVSMNITVVDITTIQNVNTGDKVVMYSNNPHDKNSIAHVAKMCGLIPYEILVGLHTSTKRIIA